MSPAERDLMLRVRVSEEEDRMLRAIADADGLTASDIVRQLVRREFIARWPPKMKTKR